MASNLVSPILLVLNRCSGIAILRGHLERSGHKVEHMENGESALTRILAPSPPVLTLLEIDPSCINGFRVLERVRRHSNHPIILLTGRTLEADRLLGFELGADDYICRPFSPREVVARINAVLRRHAQRPYVAIPSTSVRFDSSGRRASLEGQRLDLTSREFLLLQALSREPGRVFTRSRLLEIAFLGSFDVSERAVDGHIKNLRKKLAMASPSNEWIRSVYGVGFTFEEREAPSC